MTGLLAAFPSEQTLQSALAALRKEVLAPIETHTPQPLEADPPRSVLPLVILLAGLLGAFGTFALEAYATTASYPFDIGRRPYFSWPAYVPMAFEMGALAAVAAGFFGFLIANRLPHLYDPIDESPAFRRASRDAFFVAVRTKDPQQAARARAVLEALSPISLEEFLA
ncbi:MAG: DUF3341 domain-containing protein [Acidisphaera sp.]|nr:DUF3341 domain-containing protein [Acidisphaera sp.]